MVEVEVRQGDGVDEWPRLLSAETGQHTRAAVEQQPAAAFDEIPRLRPAWIGPGRRAADDRELHGAYRVRNR
jgi:hypothetical protein